MTGRSNAGGSPPPIVAGAVQRRETLVAQLASFAPFELAGHKIEAHLRGEIARDGVAALLQHLYLCGAIPETLDHDSTEEKVYSKYTDALLTVTFEAMGFKSVTLEERADSADVRVDASSYSFVADAKAFRLSRTAKNQKDFKIEAMDGWRGACDYALVVAPIFQLPTANSQIYEQAIRRGVCLLSYTHLRAIVRAHAEHRLTKDQIEATLAAVLAAPANVGTSSKDARTYWTAINGSLRSAHQSLGGLLAEESALEGAAVTALRSQELASIDTVEAEIQTYSRERAIEELVAARKLHERKAQIAKVTVNTLLDL